MNRKLIFHLCILAALVCLCGIIWMNMGGGSPVEEMSLEDKELAIQEGRRGPKGERAQGSPGTLFDTPVASF